MPEGVREERCLGVPSSAQSCLHNFILIPDERCTSDGSDIQLGTGWLGDAAELFHESVVLTGRIL